LVIQHNWLSSHMTPLEATRRKLHCPRRSSSASTGIDAASTVIGSRPNRSAGVAISRQDGQNNPKGRPGTGRMGSAWPLITHMPSGLTDLPKAISTTTQEQKINDTRLGAAG
jgi:hypothetical protein